VFDWLPDTPLAAGSPDRPQDGHYALTALNFKLDFLPGSR
jgi:hypothetical protein